MSTWIIRWGTTGAAILLFIGSFSYAFAEEQSRNGEQKNKNVSRETLMKALRALEGRADTLPKNGSEPAVGPKLRALRERAAVTRISDRELRAIAEELAVEGGRAGWERTFLVHLDRIERGSYRDTRIRAERMQQYLDSANGISGARVFLENAFGHLRLTETKLVYVREAVGNEHMSFTALKASAQLHMKTILSELKAANQALLQVAQIVNRAE